MKKSLVDFTKALSEKIYKYFGNDSGNMLLATSMIGIATSTIAQAITILFNKKYTDSQKMFMLPQEVSEGCIAALSIFFITKPIQKISNKCLKTGKILSTNMVEYLKKNELIEKRGTSNFDFQKNVQDIIHKIEISDKFIKSSDAEREKLLFEHQQILRDYQIMSDSASALAATFAGITANAFVSPLLRNHIASKFQNVGLKYMEETQQNEKVIQQNINFKSNCIYHPYSHYNRI